MSEKTKDTFATEILHELKKSSKRWFVAFLVVLTCWLATIGAFVWYLTLPVDCVVETCEQVADNESTNNYVGGDINECETDGN